MNSILLIPAVILIKKSTMKKSTIANAKTTLLNISFLITMLVTFSNGKLIAQKDQKNARLNLGFEASVSGNSHGTLFTPYVGINKGRSSINIGANVQKRSWKLDGAKLFYSYVLTGYKNNVHDIDTTWNDDGEEVIINNRLQLHFLSYVQYMDNASSCNYTLPVDETPGYEVKKSAPLHISTAEAGVGIGLRIKVLKKLYWRNFVTVSYFQHLNAPENMYQDKSGVMLTLGTGFNIPHL